MMRRLRVLFGKGEEVRYISHLDLMRTWERIFRRAGIRLSHSQGFSPRPRLVFASPLPVGVTSQAELLDVFIEEDLSPLLLAERIAPALAPGISVSRVDEVPLEHPSLMAAVESADYLVGIESGCDASAAEKLVGAFLDSATVSYQRTRKGITKEADLRPAVLSLEVDAWDGQKRLLMKLRLDEEGATVRPEEVVRVLDPDWRVVRVHRKGLTLLRSGGSVTITAGAATRAA